jgi:GMP synthase-like glutamine amidotransferase
MCFDGRCPEFGRLAGGRGAGVVPGSYPPSYPQAAPFPFLSAAQPRPRLNPFRAPAPLPAERACTVSGCSWRGNWRNIRGSERARVSEQAEARMHIGILRTDAVLEQVQPVHGDYPSMFRAALADPAALPMAFAGEPPRFSVFSTHEGELPAPDACDAYVITGSRHSVYDDLPWLPPLVEFLRAALAAERKVIGICFGHQLLAHFFGGETARADTGWCVGVHDTRVLAPQPWMQPVAGRFGLLSSHRDQVQRLPADAEPFAASERCPYAGFVIGRQVLTFQGHPEFTKPYAADLMRLREEVLGPEVFAQGMASLEQETDSALVARWILNFVAMGT